MIRMIHHLPRAGGTLICKCIGSMNDVALLSEISTHDAVDARTVVFHQGQVPTISRLPAEAIPRGGPAVTTVFHPLYQACYWLRLVRPHEIESLYRELDYAGIVELIEQRASERGDALIVRDWLYLDFWAKPLSSRPTYQTSLADVLARRFQIKRVFTVRHPLDMWLSWRSYSSDTALDFETFMYGCRRFAELAQRHGFYRYEDFTKQPSQVLVKICRDLGIAYDETYQYRWFNYTQITGDTLPTRDTGKILPLERRPIDGGLLRMAHANRDYQETLSLLGYASPER